MGFIKPMTHTSEHRCRFPRVQVRVALENPRVARDIPYLEGEGNVTISFLYLYASC